MAGVSAPRCKCHSEPMVWEPDKNRSRGGIFRCAVRRREVWLNYYHRAGGGYIQRRRRHLVDQRQQVLEKLADIQGVIDELES